MVQSKKEIFQNHLSQKWVLYILYAVLSIFIWTWAVGMVTKDKKKETVNVWIAAYDGDPGKMAEILESSQSEYLKHTRVTIQDPEAEYFSIFFQVIAGDADIVILSGKTAETYKDLVRASFVYLGDHENEMKEYFGDSIEYCILDEFKCGIKIHDKNDPVDKDSLIKWNSGAENEEPQDYYLFLNKKSLHLKGINDSEMDGALNTLESLLKDVIQ